MKFTHLKIEFLPLKLSKSFLSNIIIPNSETLFYALEPQPSFGRAKDAPPAIQINWLYKATDTSNKVIAETEANDLYSIEGVEDYKNQEGKKKIQEMTALSYKRFTEGLEVAKEKLNTHFLRMPPFSPELSQALLVSILRLLDREI